MANEIQKPCVYEAILEQFKVMKTIERELAVREQLRFEGQLHAAPEGSEFYRLLSVFDGKYLLLVDDLTAYEVSIALTLVEYEIPRKSLGLHYIIWPASVTCPFHFNELNGQIGVDTLADCIAKISKLNSDQQQRLIQLLDSIVDLEDQP